MIDKNSSRKLWDLVELRIDQVVDRPHFNQRDIWLCYLGINIGDEENGTPDHFLRPVIIIRKFNSHICLVVPLTKTIKENQYYMSFPFNNNETSTAILSQIRLVDARRLHFKIGCINNSEYQKMKEKIRTLIS